MNFSSRPDPTVAMSFIAGLLLLMSLFTLFSPNPKLSQTQDSDLQLNSVDQSLSYIDSIDQNFP